MSHKQAKQERKMTNNGSPNAPSIKAQIVINWHGGDQFSVAGIPDVPLMFLMLGKAIASIGSQCQLKEQSPIVKVPPGARIVS
jgi:hypothetical protein